MLFQPFFSCVCQQVVGWRLWLMECYLDIWSQRRMVAMMLVDMEFIFWMSVLRARQMTWNDYWDWEKVLLTFFKELFFFSKWHQFWLSCCCTFTWGIGGTSSFDLPSSRRATDLYLNLPYRQYCGIISVSFPILHPYPVLIWYQPTKNKHTIFNDIWWVVPKLPRQILRRRFDQERQKFGRFYYRFPNGEAGTDVFDRVSDFWSTLLRSMDTSPVENLVCLEVKITVVRCVTSF